MLAIGFLIGVLGLLYANFKTYPMDYVDGKLLVDPVKMSRTAWEDIGGFLAFIVAYSVEKRWVRFSPAGWNVKGVILCLLGMVPLYFIVIGAKKLMTGYLGIHWGRIAAQSILFFYVMVLWPLVLKFCARATSPFPARASGPFPAGKKQ